MCVGLSAKVVRISDGTAVVDAGGKKERSFRITGRSGTGRLCNGACRNRHCKITDEDDSETRSVDGGTSVMSEGKKNGKRDHRRI